MDAMDRFVDSMDLMKAGLRTMKGERHAIGISNMFIPLETANHGTTQAFLLTPPSIE